MMNAVIAVRNSTVDVKDETLGRDGIVWERFVHRYSILQIGSKVQGYQPV